MPAATRNSSAERLAELLRHQAHGDVGDAAHAVGHDDAHRPRRIVFSLQWLGGQAQQRDQRDEGCRAPQKRGKMSRESMNVIDIHPHVIGDDIQRYPLAPAGGHQSDWSRSRPVSLPQMIAAMKAAGVQKAALVQASTCYGHDNSYVADAVAAHPDKFTGVFSVDVLAPDATERIRHWRGERLTGLRIFSFGSTMTEQAPPPDP